MAFKKGDRVKVTEKSPFHKGQTGEVETVYDNGSCTVRLDGLHRSGGFLFFELELLDPEREALIELAETLDKARQQADVSKVRAVGSLRGVRGTIVLALQDTLAQIVGNTEDPSLDADKVYVSMLLDGNTVRAALAAVLGVE